MRELVSTATLEMMARPTLSSTQLVSMASESWEVTTSPVEDRTQLMPSLSMLLVNPRNMTTSTMMTPSLPLHLSIPMIHLTTRKICWMVTLLDCWQAEPSQHPDHHYQVW